MKKTQTITGLIQKREQSLISSREAIKRHPAAFDEIKTIVNRVIQQPVEIDEYFSIANRLARLLETMGPETIFCHYYLENIDPARHCQARFFRYICMDLKGQISELNHWRQKRRCIHLVT
ncbi:MAG: hypothetical protein SWH61_09210 [Thermodesulfobacteriota bacterium]|nr:hypothetical protein [Thermodesulfobacteriota bacterium]